MLKNNRNNKNTDKIKPLVVSKNNNNRILKINYQYLNKKINNKQLTLIKIFKVVHQNKQIEKVKI